MKDIGAEHDEIHAREERRALQMAELRSTNGDLDESRRLLVAEGDSWFDYPGADVLDDLEDGYGYEVVSVANAGDTLESMAYSNAQLCKLYRKLGFRLRYLNAPRSISRTGDRTPAREVLATRNL